MPISEAECLDKGPSAQPEGTSTPARATPARVGTRGCATQVPLALTVSICRI